MVQTFQMNAFFNDSHSHSINSMNIKLNLMGTKPLHWTLYSVHILVENGVVLLSKVIHLSPFAYEMHIYSSEDQNSQLHINSMQLNWKDVMLKSSLKNTNHSQREKVKIEEAQLFLKLSFENNFFSVSRGKEKKSKRTFYFNTFSIILKSSWSEAQIEWYGLFLNT